MLKTLAVIVVVVLVVIAGVLIYASTRPDSFRVQRSVSSRVVRISRNRAGKLVRPLASIECS